MKFSENRKIIIAIIFMVACIVIFIITDTVLGAKDVWSVRAAGEIVDVDPIACNGKAGLFFEINGTQKNHWLWLWRDDIVGRWPERESIGTFYTKKVDGEDKYKWVETRSKSAGKKKDTTKKISSVQTIKTISLTWSSVVVGLPPIDKTVLVKYKNGKTITTAYVNSKKQWKLETDRNRVAGGREITTISKWRDIQE